MSPAALAIHCIIARHPLAQAAENVAYQRIAVLRPAIMHPFPIAACFHQSCAFEMSEMPRHFRLHDTQGVGQLAYARLAAR